MKSIIKGGFLTLGLLLCGATVSAQNSVPAPGGAPNGIGWNPGPGMGGNSAPAPGSGGSFRPNAPVGPANGIGWNPGPGPGWNNGWGGGWNNWNSNPSVVVNVAPNPNKGVEKVLACGYDAQGIWRVLPMVVAYQYNGAQYNVTVLNAWNPWAEMWDNNIDQPAFNTYYFLRGVYYNFYAPLSTGTFYFNL